MKAIERNDRSDMSAQGQASINLHKWRVIIGETQSEDVQERKTIRNSPCLTSLDCTLFVEHVPRTQSP